MRKPARISIEVVASLAMALAARAQGPADPCQAAGFNGEACRQAIRRRGYCDSGNFVGITYRDKYPYYYDLYLAYVAQGGIVTPAAAERCHRPSPGGGHGASYGGFGHTGGHGHS